MRNSVMVIDINQKENCQLISSYNTETNEVKVNKFEIDPKTAVAANMLHGVGVALAALPKAVDGKRVTILVPDAIAVRTFEMLKNRNSAEDEIAALLFKSWMSEDKSADAYAAGIALMVKGYKAALARNININFVNSRTLYRYELVGDGKEALADMSEITLVNSANEDLGIAIRQGEFSFANGTYKVIKQTRRGNGGSNTHYYIQRHISATVNGERKSLPVAQAAGMPVDAVTPLNDSGITLLNVARFRAIAAAQLPKKELVSKFNVVQA